MLFAPPASSSNLEPSPFGATIQDQLSYIHTALLEQTQACREHMADMQSARDTQEAREEEHEARMEGMREELKELLEEKRASNSREEERASQADIPVTMRNIPNLIQQFQREGHGGLMDFMEEMRNTRERQHVELVEEIRNARKANLSRAT